MFCGKRRFIFIRDARGQTLVIIPFVVIILLGAILVSMNVGIASNTYIRMQTAADVAARNGALAQALGLMVLVPFNDLLYYYYGRIINRLIKGAKFGPIGIAVALALSIPDYNKIKKIQKTMDGIKHATVALVTAEVIRGARDNGAAMGMWISNPSLDLEWMFMEVIMGKWMTKIIHSFTGLKGFLVRAHSDVREQVKVAVVWKDPWQEFKNLIRYILKKPLRGTGPSLIGDTFLGKSLFYPNIKAFSCGRPYWLGLYKKRNPRNDKMDYLERFFSMRIPGTLWEAKIISFKL